MGKAIANGALNVHSSWYMTNLWLVLAGLVVVVAVGLVCPRSAGCLTPWGLSDFCAPLPGLTEIYRQQGHNVPCNTHTHTQRTHTHTHTHTCSATYSDSTFQSNTYHRYFQSLSFHLSHTVFSELCTHSLYSCHTLFVPCISFF